MILLTQAILTKIISSVIKKEDEFISRISIVRYCVYFSSLFVNNATIAKIFFQILADKIFIDS